MLLVRLIVALSFFMVLDGCGNMRSTIYKGKLEPFNMEKSLKGNTIYYEAPRNMGGEKWFTFYGVNGLADSLRFIDRPYTIDGGKLCLMASVKEGYQCSQFYIDEAGHPFWNGGGDNYYYVTSIEKGDSMHAKEAFLKLQEYEARRQEALRDYAERVGRSVKAMEKDRRERERDACLSSGKIACPN